jgi:predicted small metal-binding protein
MALEFHCADVGVACSSKTTAQTKEELLAKVSEHASSAHGVELNETLVDYALTRVRGSGGDAESDPAGRRA